MANSILFMVVSMNGVGYVFIQISTDGKVKIISCGSTGLKDAQTMYSFYNFECQALKNLQKIYISNIASARTLRSLEVILSNNVEVKHMK